MAETARPVADPGMAEIGQQVPLAGIERHRVGVFNSKVGKRWKSQFHTVHQLKRRLRRGVRSDVQSSCTETRLQKCSQTGKNGSKHPMLSISMAYNVISCKKVKRNTQKLKIADFTM